MAPPRFELGPIRPPNEATSLLVRVTRNCPWNRCTFCPVYKGDRFELRSADEVEADIHAMASVAASLAAGVAAGSATTEPNAQPLSAAELADPAVQQVARFVATGGRTAFLQDANSMLMPVDELERVLRSLRAAFPSLERVTTYARSHTLCKRSVDELRRLRDAGLDRVHVGLESGSDHVLALVAKGATADSHIEAGRRAKQAGLTLSEYVMPGLGGRALSAEHATETARVLRAIDPHFIRLRTLAVAPSAPIADQCRCGELEPMGDVEIARELRALLAGLEGVTSELRSDHVLNLLEEIEGQLPDDLPRMLATVDRFLALPEQDRDAFIVGRRFGILRRLDDLEHPRARDAADHALRRVRAQFPGPVDEAIRQLMTRFV